MDTIWLKKGKIEGITNMFRIKVLWNVRFHLRAYAWKQWR